MKMACGVFYDPPAAAANDGGLDSHDGSGDDCGGRGHDCSNVVPRALNDTKSIRKASAAIFANFAAGKPGNKQKQMVSFYSCFHIFPWI